MTRRDHHAEVPYGEHFVTNGFLVASPVKPGTAGRYQGINDDRWPIESDVGEYERLLATLGVPDPLEGVRVATRWGETLAYWRRCLAIKPLARLMLVGTRYGRPEVAVPAVPWQRIGYDVAEPKGNHSVLWHEVIQGTAPQLAAWRAQLNDVGLFEDLGTAERFIRARLGVAASGDCRGMELGGGFHFVPVLVHLYTGT